MASAMQSNDADDFEIFLIACAKSSLNHDISEAKSWLLTAKVLFPHKFGVEFLAYQIAKNTDNMQDAAKSFTNLLTSFPNEPEFCFEIQSLTEALRKFEEHELPLDTADFLVKLFYKLSTNVQRSLLLSCASKTPDALDHGKLMLLLFRKFVNDIAVLGPEVMEDLILAENRTPFQTSQNSFRKLLVCDLLPLLAQWSPMELSTNNLIRLLDKAVEFYMSCAFEPNKRTRRDDREGVFIDDPWTRLWEVILLLGHKLQWELCQTFTRYWSREAFFKSLQNFINRTDEASQLQVAFCSLVVLLRCVHEYLPIVEPANPDTGYVFIEAFCVSETAPIPMGIIKKTDDESTGPLVTAGNGAPPQLVPSFLAAIRCFDVLHKGEFIRREYLRLRGQWKVEQWLQTFSLDASMYRCVPDQTLLQTLRSDEIVRKGIVVPELVRLSFFYQAADMIHIVEVISRIAGLLANIPQPAVNNGNQLTVSTRHTRHVHFLPITRASILQYCVKILLSLLKGRNNDLALGHCLVLMQLNWPAESALLDEVADAITRRGFFSYCPLFTNFIVNIDVMERFAFLTGPNGPKSAIDIFANNQPAHSSRRMSTRGVDKGVKEDLKAALRTQVNRWNEPAEELIIRFLKTEYELLQRSLLTA